jgi:hypothetical protein
MLAEQNHGFKNFLFCQWVEGQKDAGPPIGSPAMRKKDEGCSKAFGVSKMHISASTLDSILITG